MKSYWKFLSITLLLLASYNLSAQEICDNGIDDDGNGLIDCYDIESGCAQDVNGGCDNFFFGNAVSCADEIDVTTFAIRLQWASEDRSANSHATPMVGDLDGNGIPEVVVTNRQGKSVYVLNGATGETINSATVSFETENTPVLANIDDDETAEILVSQEKGDDMVMFNSDLTVRWSAKASRNQHIGIPGVADFDEDGDVEIYYRNEIVDAATGNILVAGSANGNWGRDLTHGSLAVDILPDDACADCKGLELVSGNELWAINESTGTRTLVRDMDDDIHEDIDPNRNYYPKYFSNWKDQWSTVSAADYNLDGNIDLIITGALGTSSEKFKGETTIFFWDVTNGNVITYHDPTNNFVRGPGRVNIGDVDGDGQLNANFVMDQKLYSLDENFNIHWIFPIKEGSSGFTGCSLFDFDGDGAVEVVYRSEESLLIVDGIGNGDQTTSKRREIACISRTQEEYPVIADVDGDGASEICITCYTNNSTPFNPYSNTEFAHVRVFESDGEAWMPARGVWNQHAYYNVNINDDLTVPIEVQDHSVVFSDGLCKYADGSLVPYPSRPLNTFLNQAPILNENGCVEFASPDIQFANIIKVDTIECPSAITDVTIQIVNDGDIAVSGPLPVSYYRGDPSTSNSILLGTEVNILENFEVRDTLEITQTIDALGGEFELFAVINDNGSTPPIPDPLPTAGIPECRTDNNIRSTMVVSKSFTLTAEKINDNRKCDPINPGDPAKPNNGSARAFYFGPAPGQNEDLWIENFEDRSNGDQGDTDDTGWSSDPGSEGPSFYGVASYNGSKMFRGQGTGGANDVGVVTWTSENIDISDHTDLRISMDIFEQGNMEGSGQWRDWVRTTYELRDITNSVTETGDIGAGFYTDDFTYAQALVGNLNVDGEDSLLIIKVEIHNTGSNESHYIDNVVVSGTGPSEEREYTEPDGFVFRWYNAGDYSTIIYEGSSFSQMADGAYEVIGYFGETECYSDTVPVIIDRVEPVVRVWTYQISANTDCETPNGAIGAFVYTQTADGTFPASDTNPPQDTLAAIDGYQFTWSLNDDGTNTAIANGELLQNIREQGSGYRVTVESNLTGCFGSARQNVESTTNEITDLVINIQDISSCGGTGELAATVGGATDGFTFYWYDGASVKPTEDFLGDTYTVADQGFYTLLVEDNLSSCVKDTTLEISDISIAPTPQASLVQNNTFCTDGNGIVRADGDGAGTTTGFTFEWFLGANTLPENALPGAAAPNAFLVGSNSFELGGLVAGTYTVRVTDVNTSCFETRTVSVSDNPGTVTIDPLGLIENDINSCDPGATGSINASGMVPAGPTYRYELYVGATITGTPDFTSATGEITGLAAGDYTLLIFDEDSECTGNSVAVVIERIEELPILVANVQDDENCDAAGGSVSITSSMPTTEPASYTYELFDGHSFATQIGADETIIDGSSPFTFNGLAPGDYRVRVTNFDTQCTSFEDIVVDDISEIPTFTSTPIVNDNTSCDPANPNGFISVSIDEAGFDPINYEFSWWEGASTSGAPDFGPTVALQSLNNLQGIDYTIVARRLSTGCETVPLTLKVDDLPYIPEVVVEEVAPQTDCADGNGSLRAYVINDPNSACTECIEADGYAFQWQFNGVDIVDGAQPAGNGSVNPQGSSTNTITGLVEGQYSVVVTHVDTDCDRAEIIDLSSNQVIPTLSLTSTSPNTSCDPTSSNGTIDVNTAPAGTYTYAYFFSDGTQVTDVAPISGSATSSISGLSGDTYKVVAISDLSCTSDTLTVLLEDNPANPEFEIAGANTQDNTVCDPSLASGGEYNGSVSVAPQSGAVSITDYTINWFIGAGTGTPNAGTYDDSTLGILANLPGGTYTAQIIHSAGNLCDTTISITIGNDLTDIPVIDDLGVGSTKQDVTVCEDNVAWPNGQLDANVTGGTGSYTYRWYFGTSANAANLIADNDNLANRKGTGSSNALVTGATTDNIQNLDPGSYTLQILDSETGCLSTTQVFDILEDVAGIDFTASKVQDDYTCAGTTASGEVTVTQNSGSSTYSFEWYAGSSAVGTVLETSATLSDLEDGNYTVKVTDDATSCFITQTVTVDEFVPDVSVLMSSNPQTQCDPADGTITATASTTFTPAGPPVTYVGGNYTYQWFLGTDTSTPLVEGTDGTNVTAATASNLLAGFYTVIVTDTEVGCVAAQQTFEVADGITSQAPVAVDISGLNADGAPRNTPGDCAAESGYIVADITPNGGQSFTYQWYEGSLNYADDPSLGTPISDGVATSLIANPGVDQPTATRIDLFNVPSGIYTLVMEDNATGCRYQEVYDLPFNGQQTTTTIAIEHVESCPDDGEATVGIAENPADGDAIATPGGADDIQQYDIYLFAGDGVPTEIFSDDTFTYTVMNDDGSTATYPVVIDGASVATGAEVTFSGLPPGTYTAIAREKATAIFSSNECWSQSAVDEVEDRAYEPILGDVTVTDNTVCSVPPAGNFDGSITVNAIKNVDDTFQNGDFQFVWYDLDNDPGRASALQTDNLATASTLADRPAGNYVVEIYRVLAPGGTPNRNGCMIEREIRIEDNLSTQEIVGTVDVTGVDNCSPDDTAIITVLDANVTSGSVADYEFAFYPTLLDAQNNTNPLQAFSAVASYNVPASARGIYYIVAEHQASGCITLPYEIEVIDNSIAPIVDITNVVTDTSCDPDANEGNGSITFSITNAVNGDFSYQWYAGNTNNPANVLTDVGSITNSNGTLTDPGPYTNITVDGLDGGIYTLEIVDLTPNSQNCAVLVTETINEDINLPTLVLADNLDVQDNLNCEDPNGFIEILSVKEGGVDEPVANYTFQWFEADGVTAISGVVSDAGAGIGNRVDDLTGNTYKVRITNTATQCSSSGLVEIDLIDDTTNPLVQIAGKTADTHCTDGDNVGVGTLDVTITEPGQVIDLSQFSIEWYRGTTVPVTRTADASFIIDRTGATGAAQGSAAIGGSIQELTNLEHGSYTIFVKKDAGAWDVNVGCEFTATFEIEENNDTPELDLAAVIGRSEPDSLCGAPTSGTLIIQDGDIDGVLDDYQVDIRRGSTLAAPFATFVGNGSPEISFSPTTANALEADSYFISATNTVTGCEIAIGEVVIQDISRNPQVTLVSMTPDEDCGGGINAGALEVLADGFASTPYFTFDWQIAGGGPTLSAVNTLTAQPAGNYQVTVTNTNTLCSATRIFTIDNMPVNPSITDFVIGDNTICDDDNDGNPLDVGTFELTEIRLDGTTLDQAAMAGDYTLTVVSLPLLTPVADNDGATPYLWEELSAGSYRAIVTKNDSDCSSEGVDFEIVDNVIRPLITVSLLEADSTCSAAGSANGRLLATAALGGVNNIDHTNPDYNFNWYSGTVVGAGSDLGITTSEITGLAAGIYTVEVERISTGCISTQSFTLPNIPTDVEILAVDVTNNTFCSPANGEIEVTSVSRNAVSDYDFDYYDQNPATSPAPIPAFTGFGGAAYTDAAAGIYWLIGTNNLTGCKTPAFQIEIEDNLLRPVRTELISVNQNNCDPENPNGVLAIRIDDVGTPEVDQIIPEAPDYSVDWFFGNDTSNPLDDGDIGGFGTLQGVGTDSLSGLPAGDYTVVVTDLSTNCTLQETYSLQNDEREGFPLRLTSTPNFSCTVNDGSATASVVDQPTQNYDFYWFNGNIANPDSTAAIFKGNSLVDIPAGFYTVLVVELGDRYCNSTGLVDVQDATNTDDIPYELDIENVTVCFDVKDGYVAVNVPLAVDTVKSIARQWYDADDVLIGTQNSVDSLPAGQYRLVLLDSGTLCTTTAFFDILDVSENPPAPNVIVNNGRNRCDTPNGSAIANINGVTSNFLFEWFDPEDISTPYATGSEVSNLDSIIYIVRATNLATGCVSDFTPVEIQYEKVDPVFEIVATNSVCLRTEDGSTNQFTGTAVVSFAEFNLATDYEWRDENGILVGRESRLIDAYPGDYTVTFTAENGCTYTADFTIETALTVYNGVSANADGKNDFFLIDCVDYFPNNNVKIFNRAGQRIFEVDGYDNTSVRFEGISNVGGGGLQLPTGTYFYVIDLNNGDEPVQGYLELVR